VTAQARDTLLVDGPGARRVVKTDSPVFTYQGPGQDGRPITSPAYYFRHRVRLLGYAVLVGSTRDAVDDIAREDLFTAITSDDARTCSALLRATEDVPPL